MKRAATTNALMVASSNEMRTVSTAAIATAAEPSAMKMKDVVTNIEKDLKIHISKLF